MSLFSEGTPGHGASRSAIGRSRDGWEEVHVVGVGHRLVTVVGVAVLVLGTVVIGVVLLLPRSAAHHEALGLFARVVRRAARARLGRRVCVHLAVDHVLQVLLFQVLQVLARVFDLLGVGAFHDHHIVVASLEFYLDLYNTTRYRDDFFTLKYQKYQRSLYILGSLEIVNDYLNVIFDILDSKI